MNTILRRVGIHLCVLLYTLGATGVLIAISATKASAAPQTRVLSTAVVDASKAQAVKWRSFSFVAQATGAANFQASWTGTADVRYEIRPGTATTGAVIGKNVAASTVSPKLATVSLTAGSQYTVAIWAFSGVANYTFTITENIPSTDTTPPSVPTGLQQVTVANTAASISWEPSTDNVGVTGYKVYRNGTEVGTTSSTGFSDAGLSVATAYSYTVAAFDAAGNTSAQSAPLTVTTTNTSPSTRPNIIIINTDDQRQDTLEFLPKIRQWLVDAGTNFANGSVATPSCCPSRASLMSGQFVHNNGQVGQNVEGLNVNLTLQRYLHDAGYFTGHSGKFVHWWPLSQVAPHWDRWTYFKGGYENIWINFDGKTSKPPGYSTVTVFDRAINYLNDWETRNDDKPFFMQLTPVVPHSPFTPEAKYANAAVPEFVLNPAHNETDKSDKPQFVRNRNVAMSNTVATRTAQIRMLYTLDDQVDRLMRELEAKGEIDNTMIIFTSDNGYFWGEHRLQSKFLPYTEAVEVPFVIRWPGKVAAGVTDNRLVSTVDIAPTVLAAAGVTQSFVAMDGRDILSGYDRQERLTEYFFDTANNNGIPTWAAIRTHTYLYVEYYGNDLSTSTTPTFREYYDMVNDPYQLTNLFNDGNSANDPDRTALSAKLAAAKTCAGASCK